MKYYIYLEVKLPNEWKVGINKIAVALKTGSWPKFLTDFDDLTTKRTEISSSVRWCYQNYNYLYATVHKLCIYQLRYAYRHHLTRPSAQNMGRT